MKIEIKNYKTIKHLCFEFNGFASIVGQNFIGKSAIAGALAACLQNSIDKTAIRDGEDFCEVLFERDGLSVFWHYEESNTYYLINGQLYEKLAGALPPPLVEAGYSPVAAAEDKEYLWYIEQFKPLFVVHKDKSNFSTDLLASIFKFDSVYKALDLCRREMKQAKALEKVRSEDLKNARRDMVQVQRLEDMLPSVEDIEQRAKLVRLMDSDATTLRSLYSRYVLVSGDCDSLSLVPSVPVIECPDLASDLKSLSTASRSLSLVKDLASSVKRLRPVQSIPDLSYAGIEEGLDGLHSAKKLLAEYSVSHRLTTKLGPVKDLQPISVPDSEVTLSELRSARKVLAEYAASKKVSESLSAALSSSEVDSTAYSDIGDTLRGISSALSLLSAAREAKALASSVNTALVSSMEEEGTKALVGSITATLSSLPEGRRLCMRYQEALLVEASLKDDLAAAVEESTRLFDELRDFKSCPLCNKPFDVEKECSHA